MWSFLARLFRRPGVTHTVIVLDAEEVGRTHRYSVHPKRILVAWGSSLLLIALAAAALLALAARVEGSVATVVALCAAIGFFGASFPLIIAHSRAFFPPHLAGRGVTLMNMFGIGGVGAAQFGSGPLHSAVAATAGAPAAYATLFAVFGGLLLFGLAVYLFSRDSMG